jgi:hypothetical protein
MRQSFIYSRIFEKDIRQMGTTGTVFKFNSISQFNTTMFSRKKCIHTAKEQ